MPRRPAPPTGSIGRDGDHRRAPAFRAPPRLIDDRLERRRPIDAQLLLGGVAPDDGGVEAHFLGLERRVPVEVVGEHLGEVLLDCRRKRDRLAQHLIRRAARRRSARDPCRRRRCAERQRVDRGASRRRDCVRVPRQRNARRLPCTQGGRSRPRAPRARRRPPRTPARGACASAPTALRNRCGISGASSPAHHRQNAVRPRRRDTTRATVAGDQGLPVPFCCADVPGRGEAGRRVLRPLLPKQSHKRTPRIALRPDARRRGRRLHHRASAPRHGSATRARRAPANPCAGGNGGTGRRFLSASSRAAMKASTCSGVDARQREQDVAAGRRQVDARLPRIDGEASAQCAPSAPA